MRRDIDEEDRDAREIVEQDARAEIWDGLSADEQAEQRMIEAERNHMARLRRERRGRP